MQSHSLLQGIFPTQGLELWLLHRQVNSLTLSHPGSKLLIFFKVSSLQGIQNTTVSLVIMTQISSTHVFKHWWLHTDIPRIAMPHSLEFSPSTFWSLPSYWIYLPYLPIESTIAPLQQACQHFHTHPQFFPQVFALYAVSPRLSFFCVLCWEFIHLSSPTQ